MDTLDILEQLIQAKEVPGHLVAGNTRKNRAANKRHEMGRTFAGAAAMFFTLSPHGTFEEFKQYTVRRQFYGLGPIMWAVWIFRLISWAHTIWNWKNRQEHGHGNNTGTTDAGPAVGGNSRPSGGG